MGGGKSVGRTMEGTAKERFDLMELVEAEAEIEEEEVEGVGKGETGKGRKQREEEGIM